jgi:hypothetical protein
MAKEHPSWKIKGEDVLAELVALIGISAAEQDLLGALGPVARDAAPAMTHDFYDQLFKHDNTSEYLQGASMDRLHSMVADWFVDLFSGQYDSAYAQKRLGIGKIHVRIGLPVRYPLAMLNVVMPHGEGIARQSPQPDAAAAAFRKILALDVAIFNQAYEDNQLKHLAELVGGERLARLLLSGEA